MRLIAKKPCSFGGRKFLIGDEIPVNLVDKPKVQEQMGVISIVSDGGAIPPEKMVTMTAQVGAIKFVIPIHTEDGDINLEVTNEELTVFTDILQTPVSKAEDKQKVSEMIQKVESEDLLIVLDALDGRKHVKDEVQERVQALRENQNPDDGQNPDGGANPDDGQNPALEGAQSGGDE